MLPEFKRTQECVMCGNIMGAPKLESYVDKNYVTANMLVYKCACGNLLATRTKDDTPSVRTGSTKGLYVPANYRKLLEEGSEIYLFLEPAGNCIFLEERE